MLCLLLETTKELWCSVTNVWGKGWGSRGAEIRLVRCQGHVQITGDHPARCMFISGIVVVTDWRATKQTKMITDHSLWSLHCTAICAWKWITFLLYMYNNYICMRHHKFYYLINTDSHDFYGFNTLFWWFNIVPTHGYTIYRLSLVIGCSRIPTR